MTTTNEGTQRDELAQIKERAEAATEGPWKLWGMQVMADPVGDSNLDTALPIADTADPHRGLRTFNAEFIAEARTDVPKLVAALEAALHLHQESQGHYQNWQGKHTSGAYCETCLDEWPCDTQSSIAEALK